MAAFILWLLLLVFCWPLALLALILWPFVWLLSLPFRLVGITFEAVFALLRALLMLPARALGYRPARVSCSSQVFVEVRDGALPRQLGGLFVVARRCVVVEAVLRA